MQSERNESDPSPVSCEDFDFCLERNIGLLKDLSRQRPEIAASEKTTGCLLIADLRDWSREAGVQER